MRVFNLIVNLDRDGRSEIVSFVETFMIRDSVKNPEGALRAAVNEFLTSGTEESEKTISYACSHPNWGDVLGIIHNHLLERHGLTLLSVSSKDVFLDHDEILIIRKTDEDEENGC